MTCRAPSSSTTCAGTSTGATLSYDNEGRLSAWQDTPSSPTTTDSFLYDGAGNRVEQSVTVNGSITTTTTYIAGGLEESTTTRASTTLTKYFPGPNGLPTTERVGTAGPLSVLASDGQGTVSEALDSAGNVTSAQLFTPYGVSRYSSGSSPTAHGYTGQLADGSTGLDYYHARYYDPVAGQFTSADTVDDGFNRYVYVAGNPTTYSDPSGHMRKCDDGDCGAPAAPPPSCQVKHTCDKDTRGDGKHVSCRVDDNPASSQGAGCYVWRNWRDNMSALQQKQVQQEREDALHLVFVGLALALGALVVQFAAVNDPIRLLGLVLDTLQFVLDGLGWAATTFPKQADMIYGWIGGLTALFATLDAFDAIIHGVAAWLLWTLRGPLIAAMVGAKGPLAVLIGLLLGAGASVIDGIGQGFMTVAMTKYADAAHQENMSVWEWCAGPGKGQCAPEPNGGMPTI